MKDVRALDGNVGLLLAELRGEQREYVVKVKLPAIGKASVDINTSPHGVGICIDRKFKEKGARAEGLSSKACRYLAFPREALSGRAGISIRNNTLEIRVHKRR